MTNDRVRTLDSDSGVLNFSVLVWLDKDLSEAEELREFVGEKKWALHLEIWVDHEKYSDKNEGYTKP